MTDQSPLHKLVKFGLAGVLATALHYAVMFAGLLVWDAAVVWSFLGAVCGAILGYVLNYVYTFQSDQPHQQTTWRYAIIVVLSILSNTCLFYVFYRVFGWPVPISQVLSTLIVFLCNYLAHDKITFRKRVE